MRVVGKRKKGAGDREGLDALVLELGRWVRALSRLPDGAAKELAGDDTIHEELYAIRINDEFTVDVMNSASGFTWSDLVPYRTRIEGSPSGGSQAIEACAVLAAMRLCTACERGFMREGSIYRTRDDDGVPRALLGLECTACGRIEPDAAHIAEALAQGAEVSPRVRLQLEVAVAGATRSVARLPFMMPTQALHPKRIAVEWPGVSRRVLN